MNSFLKCSPSCGGRIDSVHHPPVVSPYWSSEEPQRTVPENLFLGQCLLMWRVLVSTSSLSRHFCRRHCSRSILHTSTLSFTKVLKVKKREGKNLPHCQGKNMNSRSQKYRQTSVPVKKGFSTCTLGSRND